MIFLKIISQMFNTVYILLVPGNCTIYVSIIITKSEFKIYNSSTITIKAIKNFMVFTTFQNK